nr:ribonuclease E [Hemiselmis andersenii]
MIQNAKHIAISENNQLASIYNKKNLSTLDISHSNYQIGSIYLGQISSVLPNINAAFIKLHLVEKNGFIQLSKLLQYTSSNKKSLPAFARNIIVQISKEPTGNKGPSLTTNIEVIGKYIILLPFGEGVILDKNLENSKEKSALKALFILIKASNNGLFIKKEASRVSEEELLEDYLLTQNKWDKICSKIKQTKAPNLLTTNVNFIKKILDQHYDHKTIKISIDNKLGAWKVYNVLANEKVLLKHKHLIIEYYTKELSFVKNLSLDISIYSNLQPRINLITGGYIVIEKTEALTAIDVNSGSFSHITNSRATLLWINCEAATEVARQLKIRNIGGIIVVDFIDMKYQKDQMTLLNHFYNVLKNDSGNPKIIQLSEIGLVELTRKRQGQNIYDIFGTRCAQCTGVGQLFRFSNSKQSNVNICSLEPAFIYSTG